MIPQPQLDPLITQAGDLIEQRTGLAVGAQFRIDLERRLHELAQGNLANYLATLRAAHPTAPEWQSLLRAFTIGETYFFRDAPLFQILRATILPDLLRTRTHAVTIWCAGCATGEEVYSVAILLDELRPDLAPRLQLFASDINAHALNTAQQGIYREWSFRHVQPDFQTRYFDPVLGGWQIKPHLRQRVTFRHANLLDGAFMPPCDLVFCRNLLLYFGRGYVEAGENVLYDALLPGGWLILGQSEAIRTQRERWQPRLFGTSILYQKPPTASGRDLPVPAAAPAPKLLNSYADALYAAHHDQMNDSERSLRTLLTSQPQDLAARLLLVYILASRHHLTEAHTHLDTILQIDPMQADAHYLRATLHLENSQLDQAQTALRAALYCQRDHPLATFLLGNLYYQAGDVTRAVRLWENAYRVVSALQPDSWFSDFSDMTAANFAGLIRNQITSIS